MLSPHVHVSTLGDLVRLLAVHGGPQGSLLADLTLGSWYPHSAAHQLAAQLGLAIAPQPLGYGEHPENDCDIQYGWRISAGIDVEAAGDAGILAAARLADEISAAIDPHTTVVILVPRPPASCPAEDEYFLHFLSRRLGGDSRVVLVDTSPPTTPGPELLGLVPGLLDPVLVLALRVDAAELTHLPTLRGGYLPVPPEWRPTGLASPAMYDELAARSGGVPWLRAYARYYGETAAAEPQLLAAQGWSALREGAGELAIRLARRAVSCTHNLLERAALLAGVQAMHIALSRYADAAAMEDPSQDLPDPLRGFLLQTKGWGLAMSPDQSENTNAEHYLTRARELLHDTVGERELLYLSNISALARLKTGHPWQALADEHDIERRVAQLRPRDYRLEYVNAINQARLYRRLGDHANARRCYHRAFATTDGLRTDSDAIHANVCLARVADAAGEPDESRRYWLRAALHWLASEVPEALAWRVVTAILGRQSRGDVVTAVADALADRLDAPVGDTRAAPEFIRHREGDPAPRWAALGNGWSLFAACPPARSPLDGEPAARRRLRQHVHTLLLTDCPDIRLASATLLAVPDNQGRELPVTIAELVSAGLFSGIRTFLLPTGIIELSEQDAAEITRHFQVRMGPAVARIDPERTVHFRRYRPPLPLPPSPQQADLIAARVLVAELPEEAWKQAGIKPRSNEICTTN